MQTQKFTRELGAFMDLRRCGEPPGTNNTSYTSPTRTRTRTILILFKLQELYKSELDAAFLPSACVHTRARAII